MAREFIGNGAVSVNGEKLNDPQLTLQASDALYGKYSVVKRGKKLFSLIIWAK
jgi:tyrosyl-tRNA synthetase